MEELSFSDPALRDVVEEAIEDVRAARKLFTISDVIEVLTRGSPIGAEESNFLAAVEKTGYHC